MNWSLEQRRRLAAERTFLAQYFPALRWVDPAGNTAIEGDLRTNAGNVYGVRVVLPPDFPDSQPDALICRPRPLPTLPGFSLHLTSAAMHTLEGDGQGNVRICHYSAERWAANISLYKVVMKVRFWLEAYEGHLRTGQSIDAFLKHMR
ncbi:MAG: hypothetical protein Q8S73_20340 [Deltaproteobacteria bacterium]|nr:hypothetical protein [Myxococcales bacterium]MDP3216469.1 hypothetical protein [Deltaproteobacteria bacterium]